MITPQMETQASHYVKCEQGQSARNDHMQTVRDQDQGDDAAYPKQRFPGQLMYSLFKKRLQKIEDDHSSDAEADARV